MKANINTQVLAEIQILSNRMVESERGAGGLMVQLSSLKRNADLGEKIHRAMMNNEDAEPAINEAREMFLEIETILQQMGEINLSNAKLAGQLADAMGRLIS